MDNSVVSVADFRILSHQIREDMLYAAWMAIRCATYPDIAAAMSEVFPKSEQESYWESCVEQLQSAEGAYGSGTCPDDFTALGVDGKNEAVARLRQAYRMRTVTPLYEYARRFGSRAAWFTRLSRLNDRPEEFQKVAGAVPHSRSGPQAVPSEVTRGETQNRASASWRHQTGRSVGHRRASLDGCVFGWAWMSNGRHPRRTSDGCQWHVSARSEAVR